MAGEWGGIGADATPSRVMRGTPRWLPDGGEAAY
jgi:hypothetical protein